MKSGSFFLINLEFSLWVFLKTVSLNKMHLYLGSISELEVPAVLLFSAR